MFISLSSSYAGNACAIRQSIINYTKPNDETQFFDWLVASMKSINQILENRPILFESTYTYPNPLNTTSINFKNFELLTSHHDIHEFNDTSITEITMKYTRRYERLIDTIKKEKQIFFIRYCKNSKDLQEEEILLFYTNIRRLNPSLAFKFILISDSDDLLIPARLTSTADFLYINLNKYVDDDVLNETNPYFKIIKQYKCVFTIVNG